jgi:hypothetical protein
LESKIYKLKNEKSAKNRQKRVWSIGILANSRRSRYQKKIFCKLCKTISGLDLKNFAYGDDHVTITKMVFLGAKKRKTAIWEEFL